MSLSHLLLVFFVLFLLFFIFLVLIILIITPLPSSMLKPFTELEVL